VVPILTDADIGEIEPQLSAESQRLLKLIRVKCGVCKNMVKFSEALERAPQEKKRPPRPTRSVRPR
jgi:hypothetical protein